MDIEEELKKDGSGAAKGAVFSSFLDSFAGKPSGEAPASKTRQAASDKIGIANLFGAKKEGETGAKEGQDAADKTKGRHTGLLFYAIVIGLSVSVVGGFLLIKKIGEDKARRSANSGKPPIPSIAISYEKQTTTPDNIFRYELSIADKKIMVTVDDLRGCVRFKRGKQLTDENLTELAAKLKETDFFAVSESQPGLPSEDGTDNLRSLTVALGLKVNSVTVRNSFPPHSFQTTVDNVEAFSERLLNIPTISLTKDERLKLSTDKFALAQRYFENKEAKADNLFNSIKHYQYVVELLDVFEPKPEMYITAIKRLKEAQTELEGQIKEHMFKGEQAYRLGDRETARNEFYQVTVKLGNEDSPDYKRARGAVIGIDDELKKRKK